MDQVGHSDFAFCFYHEKHSEKLAFHYTEILAPRGNNILKYLLGRELPDQGMLAKKKKEI